MTAPAYHTLRPYVALRDFADASGARSGAHGLCCSRCGARLRRGNYASLCAPCALAAPPPRPVGARVCPDCGMSKHYTSERCRACGVKYRKEAR